MNAGMEFRGVRAQRDRWLVSYADLMTLLLALFVVLVAGAYRKGGCTLPRLSAATRAAAGRQRAAVGRQAGPIAHPATGAHGLGVGTGQGEASQAKEQLYRELQRAMDLPAGTQNVALQKRPEGIVISMKEAGYFETGQAMPLAAADELLGRISRVVGPSGVAVRVEGHTDDQPIHTAKFHSNWELSTARAEAVLQMLLAAAEIDPSRLSVAGYGAYRPIADNGTEAGRRSNRRVDLVLLMPEGRG